MFIKDKATQGLPINSNKLFFELIDAFMNIKLCFQSPTFKGFHEFKWRCVLCTTLSQFCTMWKLEVQWRTKQWKDMHLPFVTHGLMLHYAKTFEEGIIR